MLPQRETGKAAMMLCMDVARACARRLGSRTSRRAGRDSRIPEDVFYLTLEEILGALPGGRQATASSLRDGNNADEYLQMELPESWVGMVEPLQRARGRGRGAPDRTGRESRDRRGLGSARAGRFG